MWAPTVFLSHKRKIILICIAALAVSALAIVVLSSGPRKPADRAFGIAGQGGGIVILGTSLSHGNWPQDLAQTLTACGIDPGPVTRITQPGASSHWGLAQLNRVIAAKPALVMIEFAINDADLFDGLGAKESRTTHVELVTALERALPEATLVFMTMSPVRGIRRLQRPFLARSYAMVRDVAAQTGAGLIDLTPRWHAYLDEADRVEALPDGLHPTPQAFRDAALPSVVAQLAQAYGAGPCDVVIGES